MNTDIRQQIETALGAFSGSDLRTASIGLLNSLGYQSEKTLDLDNTPGAFLAEFDKRDRKFRKDKALFGRWKSVEFLFQITDDEVRNASAQGTLFDFGYDHENYQSYLFFALDLEKNHYTRTQLADITREINLLFGMPAMLLIRHNGALTFSIIDRRLHKKDQSRDVLEKVKLIKDIRYQDPHRAHIEILHDLSLQALMAKHECRDFKQLHEAWRTTLDTNELNKKFYRELADWYFWALEHVEFPADVEKDTATRNATNVIRLLTRLIFCWFLKEKGLISAGLFSERKLATVLKSLKDEDSSFYRAILQNLFFGTLNQRMNTGGRENRRFANDGSFLERKDEYGVKNLYRYQKLFAIAEEEAVNLFSDIPFMNGGLFDCLDKEDDSDKKKVIYVDGFTRNTRKQPKVPNFLFFSDYRTLDLSDAYGDKKRKKEKVRGLINLLDSYKFTITENTPIEEEIALDPELLGKVFENLLASYNPETGTTARKQTGSFYTPREIVNYMVDESLIAYLTQALSKGEGSGGQGAGAGEQREPGWKTTDKASYAGVKEFTRQNRRNRTEAESVLWERLRNRLLGVKFRRQHAIGKYISDFVCLEKKLVVEADGPIHDKQKDADAERDESLLKQGYRTLRFSNDEIIDRTDHVLETIKAAISEDQGESGSSPPLEGIEGRLREIFAYTEKGHPFDEVEVEALIDAIDTCKILDPACGSGAFPMGILHKLVFILGKLDPNNDRWKQKQLEKLDSVSMREELERIFENNDDDYGRKLYLIENCIYGVDIQPIAIQISKLRFFISLICDQRTNKNKAQNCGVRPLPNLETKFVAANTLISLDRGQGQLLLTDPHLPKLEEELTAVRHRHFAAQRRRDKLALQRRDAEIREEISAILAGGGMSGKASHRLAAWDPYDQNASASFFDPEWMYGVRGGFSVTIGNPPYVRADEQSDWNQLQRKAILLSKQYETLWEKWDLYVPFIERSYKLLKSNGVTSLIVSDAYCHSKYAQKSQNWFLQNSRILRLDFFGKIKIFDAGVHNMTYFFQRADGTRNKPERRVHEPEFGEIRALATAEQEQLTYRLFFPEKSVMTLPGIPISEMFYVTYGLRPSSDENEAKGEFKTADLVSETCDKVHSKPYVEGKHLSPWYRTTFLWLEWGTERAPKRFCRPTFPELYTVSEKLIAQRSPGPDPLVCYDDERLVFSPASVGFVPWHLLKNVRNRSIKKSSRYQGEKPARPDLPKRELLENTSRRFSAKYVLAVMNSTVARDYLRANRRSNIHLYPDDWKKLPIPDVLKEMQDPIVTLVDQILDLKKNDSSADVSELEQEVDAMVAKLYGVAPAETATAKERGA